EVVAPEGGYALDGVDDARDLAVFPVETRGVTACVAKLGEDVVGRGHATQYAEQAVVEVDEEDVLDLLYRSSVGERDSLLGARQGPRRLAQVVVDQGQLPAVSARFPRERVRPVPA